MKVERLTDDMIAVLAGSLTLADTVNEFGTSSPEAKHARDFLEKLSLQFRLRYNPKS